MPEPTRIKTVPDSVSENTEPQTDRAQSVKGEQTQQNQKGLENSEGVNALEPEPLETDSFLKALIEHNQNKAPAQETNQADVEALQQLIAEGADPTQLLEETAAGEGEPTDGGGIYIPTIDRTAEEVLADTGFDTTATGSVNVVEEELLLDPRIAVLPVVSVSLAEDGALAVTEGSGSTVTLENPVIVEGNAVSVLEGTSESTKQVTFVISLNKVFDKGVQVTYELRSFSADNPEDWFNGDVINTVTIPTGETTLLVTVEIVEDHLVEGDEQFDIVLVDAVNATINPEVNSVVITIYDDDNLPEAFNDSYVTEEDTPITISTGSGVLLNDTGADNGEVLTVTGFEQPANGTVTLNEDGSFTYTPAADFNGQDSFTYSMTDGFNGESSATVSINVTSDLPTVSVEGTGVEGTTVEEGNFALFTVNLSELHESNLTVDLSLANGTADASDYDTTQFFDVNGNPIGNSVTFAAGVTSIDVYVQTIENDPDGEALENYTVTATLAGSNSASLLGGITDPALPPPVPPVDSEPTISVTDGTVDEKGLVAGSGELADGDGTNNSDVSETTTGTFTYSVGSDTPEKIEVQDKTGIWITVSNGSTVQGDNGVLTISETGGAYSWSYTLANKVTHTGTDLTGAADPVAGESFEVRVSDSDPETSAVTTLDITINDDGPVVSISAASSMTATVDETATSSVTAVISTGTYDKGDDPDVSGSGYIGQAVTAGAVVTLSTETYGADGAATSGAKVYALTVTTASSGLTLTDGSAINLVNEAGTIVGVVQGTGTFAGKAAFAITINTTTGVVTVEQYLSLAHPDEATATNSFDSYDEAVNLATGSLGVTVTLKDGDNDTVTSTAADISGQVSFKDDGSSAFTPTTLHLIDDITAPNSETGALNFVSGADGVDLVNFTFTDGAQATDKYGNHICFIDSGNAEHPLYLHYGSSGTDYTLLEAKTSSGALAFSIDIDPQANTFTLLTNGIITNKTATTSSSIASVGGGNMAWKAFIDLGGTEQDALLTTTSGSTINTSQGNIGISGGNSFNDTEGYRIDLVNGLTTSGNGGSEAYSISGLHNTTNSFRQVISWGGSANLTLSAIIANDLFDPFYDDADDNLVSLTKSNVVVYDQNGFIVSATPNGLNYKDNTDDSNITLGTIVLTGLQQGWTFEINTDPEVVNTAFNAVQVDGFTGTSEFKLGVFSYGENSYGDPVELSYAITGVDGDGDTVDSALAATLYPVGATKEGDGSANTLEGNDFVDYLLGQAGGDTLNGKGGDDILVGGADDDTLDGGNDHDILLGGFGDDALTGGSGNDTFKWQAGETGTDTITDWGTGIDKLDLSELLQGEGVNATATTLDAFLDFSYAASNTTLTIDVDGLGNDSDQVIVFEGVDLTQLGNDNQSIITSLLGSSQLITD